MTINIAMPVAYKTAGADYAIYYQQGQTVFRIREYFNRGGCQGLCLELTRDLELLPPPPTSAWDLYAFTDGFLSFQNNALVLRLPKELNAAWQQFNSLRHLMNLTPAGPQLRHVLYAFPVAPGAAVEDKIRNILSDAAHPGLRIILVPNPAGGPKRPKQTLQAFLAADPANLNNVVQDFMNGNTELFVQAGDVIGNFMDVKVDIRFLDSCGTFAPAPKARVDSPITPFGRPLNPSYFLYMVRRAGNAAHVNMKTNFQIPPPDLDHTHPLDHLLSQASIAAAKGNLDQVLDVAAAHPPKPLNLTLDVKDNAGNTIAGKGLPVAALGDWHEARNASNPYNTDAPVQWRNYGAMAGDNVFNDYCKFLTQVKAGQDNLLPNLLSDKTHFNHQHAPASSHHNGVQTYWERYAPIFNVVAEAFEVPCEILVTIACKETAQGRWFNNKFAKTHEMDTIRMEPLATAPAAITPDTVHRGYLNNYLALAGGVGGDGANADIPVPWSGGGNVREGNPLRWDQLEELVDNYPKEVRVSPGVMQTLISTAKIDLKWINEIYGNNYIRGISIVHNGVNLVCDDPPNNLDDLFSDWFGVAVDAAGNNTNNAANVAADLTKMKRALHNIVAGASHIKRRYNTVEGGKNPFNLITDFDLPTLCSGYNDGADKPKPPRTDPKNPDDRKWNRLFDLVFFGPGYPQEAPRFFNAAVEYFNNNFNIPAPPQPRPALRLWRT